MEHMRKRLRYIMLTSLVAIASNGAVAHDGSRPHAPYEHELLALKSWFEPAAVVVGPTLVDCTLSGGTKTKCFSITLSVEPVGYKAGPWCPRNIKDGPDKSGIWLDQGRVYSADGAFVENLKAFYKDDRWQMYDAKTGNVNVTTSKESCQAAARPDVDPKYRNYCVECQTSYLPAGTTRTYVIPIMPVKAKSPGKRIGREGVGVAFSGPLIDGPAPIHAILGAQTLAPFDVCGGHVNPHAGYHIHAVTDCVKKIVSTDGHAPAIGIAMDGFPIHARLDSQGVEAQNLDRCGGHAHDALGYHYHAADPGKNAVLGCHAGEHGCAADDPKQPCDASRWGAIRRFVWRSVGYW
jgi:YHYH protein